MASARKEPSVSEDRGRQGTPDGVPVARCVVGGVLMGLANLVPGISGGTMLLAAGVYRAFISAMSELSTLRFRRASLGVAGLIAVSAAAAIVLFAGGMKHLVIEHRWAMYSLFIGLTLGGVPILHKLARPIDASAIAGTIIGIALMAATLIISPDQNAQRASMVFLLFAGIAGASAMILPGISGAYLLLLLGVYLPILDTVDQIKDAIGARDLSAILAQWRVIVPIGVGVIVGIAGVSNLLKWLLVKFEKATLGFLLGLVLGSVLGLYPFREYVDPLTPSAPMALTEAELVEAGEVPLMGKEHWPLVTYAPAWWQVAASLGLIGAGFMLTMGVAWIGRDKRTQASTD